MSSITSKQIADSAESARNTVMTATLTDGATFELNDIEGSAGITRVTKGTKSEALEKE